MNTLTTLLATYSLHLTVAWLTFWSVLMFSAQPIVARMDRRREPVDERDLEANVNARWQS